MFGYMNILKKQITFFFAIVAMSISSCSEDAIISDIVQESTSLVICASPEPTRTVLGEDGNSVLWEESDEIAVYDYVTTKHRFTIMSASGSDARFVGAITSKKEDFVAVYPYSLAAEDLSATGDVVVNLPSRQNASVNSFATDLNISVAKGARNVDGSPSKVTFYNVCQLLKFRIPAYADGKIREITFSTNIPVAGAVNVSYTGNMPVATMPSEGSSSITVLPPSGASAFSEGTYYIVSAPVRMTGFTMSFVCDGLSYSLSSSSSFGGIAGKIYNLGSIDLVNSPTISANHVYTNGTLLGTSIKVSNAPIDGSEWSVQVKNSSGVVVRSIHGIGTLHSSEDDAAWPYLPKGAYTAEYTYTTSNGKEMSRTLSFDISESPIFTVTTKAFTSYSYYKGDGVEKNVATANSLDNYTIYTPQIVVNNISNKILNNSNYNFKVSDNFGGSLASNADGIYLYNSYTVTSCTSYTLNGSVEFDGVTQSSSKIVHITGLPYNATPPTRADWTGNAYSWETDHVVLHYRIIPAEDHVITRTFYCPENMNVSVYQNVRVRQATVGTTYRLRCSGVVLKSISPGYMTTVDDTNAYDAIMTAENPSVSCSNSYGNPDWLAQGTNAQVYSIRVQYK